jgi:HK97 family phage prohead protease|tara:strand:- start:1621 stop:2301 length:681 start_codon:yes stop_codon:yes gene_type:complete
MIIYKQAPIADIDEKAGIVKGYGSIFGNKDSDDDIIEKGAYRKTLQENGKRIKYIYQHDITKPLGVMKELFEDDKGLAFTAEVPKTQLGKDVLELMKFGVIEENSVGIMPIVKEYDDQKQVRYLKEVKLYEVSAVTLAANNEAKIDEVKSEKERLENIEKRYNRLIKLVKGGNISDEMGYLLEYELQCLKANIDFTKPTEEVTLPDNKLSTEEVFKFLYNRLGNKS